MNVRSRSANPVAVMKLDCGQLYVKTVPSQKLLVRSASYSITGVIHFTGLMFGKRTRSSVGEWISLNCVRADTQYHWVTTVYDAPKRMQEEVQVLPSPLLPRMAFMELVWSSVVATENRPISEHRSCCSRNYSRPR